MLRKLFSLIILLSLSCARFDAEKKPPKAEKPIPIPVKLVEEKPKPPEGPEKPKPPEELDPLTFYNFEKFLKVEVIGSDTVEKYLVKFSWKKPSENLDIFISFQKSPIAGIELLNIGDKTEFSHEVLHNQTINYTFYISKFNPSDNRAYVTNITIPKDYVVTSGDNNNLQETLIVDANRFFMLKNVKLVTNGKDLKIKTNLFVAENATIETFPEGKTSNTENAQSGGVVELVANKGIGNLNILMRGENGKRGNDAIKYYHHLPGAAEDGVDADYKWITRYNVGKNPNNEGYHHCSSWKTVDQKNWKGEPTSWYHNLNCCVAFNGTNAKDGRNGDNGGNGFNGGHSGDLTLIVDNKNEFKFNYQLLPGKGGLGGLGTLGQRGGKAPKPVTNPDLTCIQGGSKFQKCPWKAPSGNYSWEYWNEKRTCYGAVGRDGTDGANGSRGGPGLEGSTGKYTDVIEKEEKK